ncbi:MAG: hypothetical protein M3Q98_01800 [Actinomycetota bacterium]|nr:hypothetical protein [Actinomycetota bacterium]
MRNFTKRTAAVLAATLLLVGIAGVAFAYWTQGGDGTGGATTGTSSDVTVNQTSSVTGLAPGGVAKNLSGTFTNTNAGPVHVGSVTASVVEDPAVGCDAAWYSIGGTADVDADVITGSAWSGLTISLDNSTDNQDACKDAAVVIEYVVSAS